MAMTIITVEGLSKIYNIAVKEAGIAGTLKHFWDRQYRQIAAVKDISLAIAPGEMVGFLGPNGAGKTTTLKMLTGLIHPSSGRISLSPKNHSSHGAETATYLGFACPRFATNERGGIRHPRQSI
jgi:ABC-type uncharacterized transport system ATPase subunit